MAFAQTVTPVAIKNEKDRGETAAQTKVFAAVASETERKANGNRTAPTERSNKTENHFVFR